MESSALEAALAEARPEGDALALELARGRMGAALFDELAQPTRLGRFVLLQRLGTGGMGVVYAAYDPELDRRVALKLLHGSLGGEANPAHKRLAREARALAHLSHPNVVPVHDVCVLDDKIALVMELVAGRTLRAWQQAAQPRAVRDVLDVYVQAARGLAAAHAAGIVHRDFKPDNAIVGDDGRVRVVDFGLAQDRSSGQGGEERGREPATSVLACIAPTALDQTATAPGARLGTPSYMAPEQFAGEGVGPAADQFAFCVSLYEALYGERPFDGASSEETIEDARAERLRALPKDRRVPGWVHAAIDRGLAAQPADRHPSMDALIAALSRDPARTRRRALVGVAAVLPAAIAVYAVKQGDSPMFEPCAGGKAEVATVWNLWHRVDIARALRSTGRAYAEEIEPELVGRLNRYANNWASKHREVCMSHRRGEQSAALLDQRMRCLDRRLRALDSAVAVLGEIDAERLPRAMEVVERLPLPQFCDNLDALAAEVPPPDGAARAALVSALSARLDKARALEAMGRYPDAVALAGDVVREAEPLGYEPVLAEALLAQGRARMMIDDSGFADAVPPLRRAAELGLAKGMSALVVEALARRIYVQSMAGDDQAKAKIEIDTLIPLAESISQRATHDELAPPLLLNNLGAVFLERGERDRARGYYERANEAMKHAPRPPVELLRALPTSLAMLTRDAARRDAILDQGLERLKQTLGDAHPWTLSHRVIYAHYTPDPAHAWNILAPACKLYESLHPDQVTSRLHCLYYQGFLESERGFRAQAASTLAEAAALDPGRIPRDDLVRRDLAAAYAALYRGAHAAALATFRTVIGRSGEAPAGVWAKEPLAHARLGLGLAQQALGAKEPAARELEAAAALLQELAALNENVEHKQRLAIAAAALTALRRAAPAPTR